MSVVAQSLKRPWLAAGVAGMVALALAGAIVATKLPGKRVISQGGGAEASIAATDYDQPAWRVEAYPAGASGKITKADRALISKQRVQLESVVTPVYDALFLQPGALKKAVRSTFTKGAAAEMLRTRAGLSPDASDVRIVRRVARIGIGAEGARQAAAAVKVIARAEVDGRAIEIKHRSILWLTRDSSGWRVIGFDVEQAPVHEKNGNGSTKAEGRAKKHGGHAKGKKRS
jgi:hypothetical protein